MYGLSEILISFDKVGRVQIMVAQHIALLHFSIILLNTSSDKKVNVCEINLWKESQDFDSLLSKYTLVLIQPMFDLVFKYFKKKKKHHLSLWNNIYKDWNQRVNLVILQPRLFERKFGKSWFNLVLNWLRWWHFNQVLTM